MGSVLTFTVAAGALSTLTNSNIISEPVLTPLPKGNTSTFPAPSARRLGCAETQHYISGATQLTKNGIFYSLQFFRVTQVLGFGGCASTVSANEFNITNVFFVFLEIIFYKPHILSHAKMGFVPGMRLCNLQIQRKPFRHIYLLFFN
jgi:hypothetical protein